MSRYGTNLIFINPRGNPLGEGGYHVCDLMTPNPDLDATANEKLWERTEVLRAMGLKASPVIVTSVDEVPLNTKAIARVAEVRAMDSETIRKHRRELMAALGVHYAE